MSKRCEFLGNDDRCLLAEESENPTIRPTGADLVIIPAGAMYPGTSGQLAVFFCRLVKYNLPSTACDSFSLQRIEE